jgi:hypothetical protein
VPAEHDEDVPEELVLAEGPEVRDRGGRAGASGEGGHCHGGWRRTRRLMSDRALGAHVARQYVVFTEDCGGSCGLVERYVV